MVRTAIDGVLDDAAWQASPRTWTNMGFNITDVALPQAAFITCLLTASFDYVFSSSLSFVNLVRYDNVNEPASVNLRLNWMPQEGEEFFVVINHMLEDFARDSMFSYTNQTLML